MYQLISIFLFILLSFNSYANCVQDYDERLPWQSIDSCDEYKEADAELNLTYKKLTKLIEKSDKTLLKKSQKDWILWRNETCKKAEDDALPRCSNVSCLGLAKDSCLIELTKQRTTDFLEFQKNIKQARQNNFSFSKRGSLEKERK